MYLMMGTLASYFGAKGAGTKKGHKCTSPILS